MAIKTAWLVTNYTCNNNCNFCYLRHIINTDSKLMSLNYAFDVIDELVRIHVKRCIIIGGEPTLYPYLSEIIEYGEKSGLRMSIVTNGRKLADKIFIGKLADAGVSGVSISVEASRKEDYTTTCGIDGFEETIQGIKNCISIGISISSITTICNSNHFKIVDIIQLIHSLGVRNIVLNFGVPSLDVSDGGTQYLAPSELAEVAYKTFCMLKKNFL